MRIYKVSIIEIFLIKELKAKIWFVAYQNGENFAPNSKFEGFFQAQGRKLRSIVIYNIWSLRNK